MHKSVELLLVEDNEDDIVLMEEGYYPVSTDTWVKSFASLAEMPVAGAAGHCASVRYSQRYPLSLRLLSGTAAGSRALVLSTPKKLSVAALSAQLPTALMLQVRWWAAKNCWLHVDALAKNAAESSTGQCNTRL